MRNHKTGCNRCSRNVCCCPAPVTPTGNAGLEAFANVLDLALGYMNNSGDGGLSATPRNYPIGQATVFKALAVHLGGTGVLAPGETITVTLLKNGAPTALTVTFDSVNLTTTARTLIAAGSVAYAAGDLFDLQVTDPGPALSGVDISATIS